MVVVVILLAARCTACRFTATMAVASAGGEAVWVRLAVVSASAAHTKHGR